MGIPNVVAKINDPVRAAAYAELGIATICRTRMMVQALTTHLGLPGSAGDPAALGVTEATGHHPGGDHSTAAAVVGSVAGSARSEV